MKKIKCMTCGAPVENEYNWHCDDCRDKADKKRSCNHMPKDLAHETVCIRCHVPLRAMDWRPA